MPAARRAKLEAAARIRAGRGVPKREEGRERSATRRQLLLDGNGDDKSAKRERTEAQQRIPKGKTEFGLIQERYQHNLYHLVVQAILWNQTRGKQARNVLEELLRVFPDAAALAQARLSELETMLYPIGLYKQRAKRLKALGQEWVQRPPTSKVRYKARASGYELASNGDDDKDGVGGVGWEIAHLPGVGPYALDSFRIFHRDQLRGLAKSWDDTVCCEDLDEESKGTREQSAFTPEWQRVVPQDKDLRAFLIWAWQRQGYNWDPHTGRKRSIAKAVA